jgi:hypothetical protein
MRLLCLAAKINVLRRGRAQATIFFHLRPKDSGEISAATAEEETKTKWPLLFASNCVFSLSPTDFFILGAGPK